ncbi:hypothetical protein MHU86_22473 [Fragilaria crotonensis]|nr:hypothetical protein MHU86_22473 [Fragilaria crotonensis]
MSSVLRVFLWAALSIASAHAAMTTTHEEHMYLQMEDAAAWARHLQGSSVSMSMIMSMSMSMSMPIFVPPTTPPVTITTLPQATPAPTDAPSLPPIVTPTPLPTPPPFTAAPSLPPVPGPTLPPVSRTEAPSLPPVIVTGSPSIPETDSPTTIQTEPPTLPIPATFFPTVDPTAFSTVPSSTPHANDDDSSNDKPGVTIPRSAAQVVRRRSLGWRFFKVDDIDASTARSANVRGMRRHFF